MAEDTHNTLSELDEDEFASEEEDHVSMADSSSSEDEKEWLPELLTADFMVSPDGTSWSSLPPTNTEGFGSQNTLYAIPGPTYYAKNMIQDEYSAFQLLLPESLKEMILLHSNEEGRNIYGAKWTKVDMIELEAYVGLLLLAGVYRSSNEQISNLWDDFKGRGIFRATMTFNRFCAISRIIRFDDKESRQRRRELDKFAPIRELWNKWIEILPSLYNPEPFVTIDKECIPFKGKCPFRQYVPGKTGKCGLKFWVLCDVESNYIWGIQPCLGRRSGSGAEEHLGSKIVLDLSDGLLGHNVTCNSFFTTFELGQMLLKRNITMIGMIKKNKPSLPFEVINTKNKQKGSSTFAFTGNTTIVSYIPKKSRCIVLQSTLHNAMEIESNEPKRPQILIDYQKTKGAVENIDKVIAMHTSKRKTSRWSTLVFQHMLDISALNAFILYLKVNSLWKPNCLFKRRTFLEDLGGKLIQKHIERRKQLPKGDVAKDVVETIKKAYNAESTVQESTSVNEISGSKKRGRCHMCKKSDNKSSNKCFRCNKYTCKKHFKNICIKCFDV